jgi:hypothetical protein
VAVRVGPRVAGHRMGPRVGGAVSAAPNGGA